MICDFCKKEIISTLNMTQCEQCKSWSCSWCNGMREGKPKCPKCGYNYGIEQKKEKEGCFIATACYGADNAPDVLALRVFRDKVLLSSEAGRAFVRFYYLLSPPIANMIASRNFSRSVVRHLFIKPIASFCGSKMKKIMRETTQ